MGTVKGNSDTTTMLRMGAKYVARVLEDSAMPTLPRLGDTKQTLMAGRCSSRQIRYIEDIVQRDRDSVAVLGAQRDTDAPHTFGIGTDTFHPNRRNRAIGLEISQDAGHVMASAAVNEPQPRLHIVQVRRHLDSGRQKAITIRNRG
jgi:hypothetical protein